MHRESCMSVMAGSSTHYDIFTICTGVVVEIGWRASGMIWMQLRRFGDGVLTCILSFLIVTARRCHWGAESETFWHERDSSQHLSEEQVRH